MTRWTTACRGSSSLIVWGLACGLIGCGSPLVGGECRPGYAACAGECVALTSDPRHCGACNHDCGPLACNGGGCVMSEDAGDGVPPSDGAISDGRIPADASMDSGLRGCGLGLTECAAGCVDLAADRAHCGGCGSACGPSELCEAGRCVQACSGGAHACGGGCFDTWVDPRHCGVCGATCASGICERAACADAIPGQLVVVGHSYERSNRFQTTLLGNALFLGQGAPVRALVYEGLAEAASVAGVHNAIDMVSESIGRAWTRMEAESGRVTAQLGSADVFLIHAQAGANNSRLNALGAAWGTALSEFLARGGVVVLIEGASADNRGTFQVLEPSGIFRAAGRAPLVSQELSVVEPGTGIALRVGARYRGEADTVGFLGIDTPGAPVSVHNGTPVVFQRIVR